MPELPEVNTVQKLFDAQVAGQQIISVDVSDDHIIRNLTGDSFTEKLTGQSVTGSYRQGKYLFAQLKTGHVVLLHLGMTGDLVYYDDPVDRPRHERFHWRLSNGQNLGFDDPRKFGRILYLEDLKGYLEEIKLGPDAMRISEQEFLNKMEGRKTRIKVFLLDQSILAGVGNLYADELCYQCKVHPASLISAIPKRKRKELYHKLQEILTFACEHDAYYGVYPENWFWKWREVGTRNPNGRGTVAMTKIGGRSTYFVDGWQKNYT